MPLDTFIMNSCFTFEFAPYRCSGVVYGVMMNDPRSLQALGNKVNSPPYKAPPKAPVLYLKPRNTLAVSGSELRMPAYSEAVKINATLGIVIKQTACRVNPAEAMNYVAGYIIVNDACLPLDSYYRPSVRHIARDGFCPMGPCVVPASAIPNPDALAVLVYVASQLVYKASTAGMVRPVATLLSDVTDFMTLKAGDILMLGATEAAPLARAGQQVAIEIEGLGRLENTVVVEDGPL